jgi:hypothetical protein
MVGVELKYPVINYKNLCQSLNPIYNHLKFHGRKLLTFPNDEKRGENLGGSEETKSGRPVKEGQFPVTLLVLPRRHRAVPTLP